MTVYINGVAVVAAARPSILRYRRQGLYHHGLFHAGANKVYAIDANKLYAVPFVTPEDITVTDMAIEVQTQQAGNLRAGVYEDGVNLYPGALLSDAGTFDVSTTGFKELSSLSIDLLADTLYWLTMLSDVTPTLWGVGNFGIPIVLGHVDHINKNSSLVWAKAQAYGALPDPFPGGAIDENCGNIPIVMVKW